MNRKRSDSVLLAWYYRFAVLNSGFSDAALASRGEIAEIAEIGASLEARSELRASFGQKIFFAIAA